MPRLCMLAAQRSVIAWFRALVNEGMSIAMRTAMMEMTTRSSINVNAMDRRGSTRKRDILFSLSLVAVSAREVVHDTEP